MNKKIGNIVSEKSGHENDLKILRYLQERQKVSQRELSQFLGISLGKVNFILKALIDKGIVKARNFVNNKNKRAYAYFLTKEGFEEKARLTIRFFKRKSKEYDDLRHELEELEEEIGKTKNKISDK